MMMIRIVVSHMDVFPFENDENLSIMYFSVKYFIFLKIGESNLLQPRTLKFFFAVE